MKPQQKYKKMWSFFVHCRTTATHKSKTFSVEENKTCHTLDKGSTAQVGKGNRSHEPDEEDLFPYLSTLQNYKLTASDNIQDSLVLSL